MPAAKGPELMQEFAQQRQALRRDIDKANKDWAKHVRRVGVTLHLDARIDTLTMAIGDRTKEFYTQGAQDMYLDLDPATNRIVGMTILDFNKGFLKTELGLKLFGDMAPALRAYGVLHFPPEERGTYRAARQLHAAACIAG